VLYIALEILIESQNQEVIFLEIIKIFPPLLFWNCVDYFIKHYKFDLKVPILAILQGVNSLDNQSIKILFTSVKFLQGVKEDEEYYCQIMNILKKRRLWDVLVNIFEVRKDKLTLQMLLICLLSN
jgi:hypothetical protein